MDPYQIFMHMCTCLWKHTDTHASICAHASVHVSTYVHTCLHAYEWGCTCECTNVHAYVGMQAWETMKKHLFDSLRSPSINIKYEVKKTWFLYKNESQYQISWKKKQSSQQDLQLSMSKAILEMERHTFVQRAKNKDVWRWAWEKDMAGSLGKEVWIPFINSFSEAPTSEFWEPLIEVSWLPVWKKIVNKIKLRRKKGCLLIIKVI